MTAKKRVTIIGLLEIAAIGLAVFSLGTMFAGLHRHLELFSHFRAQYFVAAIFLLLIFAILRRRNFALMLCGLALLNAWFVVPWYVGGEQPVANGATIKLLQANVLHSNQEPAALLAQIASEQPDIVVIQEMSPVWLRAMQGLADDYPFEVAEARIGAFGIGLFSKVPIVDGRIVHVPPIDLPEIRATLQIDGRHIQFVSSHPMSPISRAHIEARNAQMANLGLEVGAMYRPTILMGDLNITAWAPTYKAFETATGLRNARKGFGLVPTFPVFLPIAGIPIDHVLVSSEIAVLEFRQGARTGSDHWPIIVTLRLPQ